MDYNESNTIQMRMNRQVISVLTWSILSFGLLSSCTKVTATFSESVPNGNEGIKIIPRWDVESTTARKIVRPTLFGILGGGVSYGYFSVKPLIVESTFTNSSGKTTTKKGEVSPAIMSILGAGLGVTIHFGYPPKTYKGLVVHPTKYTEWLNKYNSGQAYPYRLIGTQGEYLLLSHNAPKKPEPEPKPDLPAPPKTEPEIPRPVYSKKYALLIGNDEYKEAMPLTTSINDIAEVEKHLTNLGFKVKVAPNVTKNSFEQTLFDFKYQAKEAEVVLFYYVGHGREIDNENCLIPIEAKINSTDQLRFSGIKLSYLITELSRLDTKINLLYLDVSQSQFERAPTRAIISRGFRATNSSTPPTMRVYYAGIVVEKPVGSHGLFTEAFIKNIRPGIDSEDLMRHIIRDVADKTGKRQRPSSVGSVIDFSF